MGGQARDHYVSLLKTVTSSLCYSDFSVLKIRFGSVDYVEFAMLFLSIRKRRYYIM